ncbi:MAG: hypothetical protein OEW58_05760 [Gammaproteobacteria bacterium]|nr:hypothetical protein [Gammaproteobacteria bacterium]
MQNSNELTYSANESQSSSVKSLRDRIFSLIGMPMLFVLVTLAIVQAWLVKDYRFIDAEEGLGYWLGIGGGVLMLLLLLYPLRKHINALHFLGKINVLFRIHMVFGILGPTLIVLHTNFQLGALNSNVALFCMLIVATSGLMGRYLYFRIHSRLSGKKLTTLELQKQSLDSLRQLNEDLPNFNHLTDYLDRYKNEGHYFDHSMLGFIFSPWLRLKRFLIYRDLSSRCQASIKEHTSDKKQQKLLISRTQKNLKLYIFSVLRLAKLDLYQRTFSLWHVLHLPLFMMMLVTGIFHVIAVHMY